MRWTHLPMTKPVFPLNLKFLSQVQTCLHHISAFLLPWELSQPAIPTLSPLRVDLLHILFQVMPCSLLATTGAEFEESIINVFNKEETILFYSFPYIGIWRGSNTWTQMLGFQALLRLIWWPSIIQRHWSTGQRGETPPESIITYYSTPNLLPTYIMRF